MLNAAGHGTVLQASHSKRTQVDVGSSPPQDFSKEREEKNNNNKNMEKKCTPTLEMLTGHFWLHPLVKTGYIIGINSFMRNGKGRGFRNIGRA